MDILLDKLRDPMWCSPRSMIQGCYTPTNNDDHLRDDYILVAGTPRTAITDHYVRVMQSS